MGAASESRRAQRAQRAVTLSEAERQKQLIPIQRSAIQQLAEVPGQLTPQRFLPLGERVGRRFELAQQDIARGARQRGLPAPGQGLGQAELAQTQSELLRRILFSDDATRRRVLQQLSGFRGNIAPVLQSFGLLSQLAPQRTRQTEQVAADATALAIDLLV